MIELFFNLLLHILLTIRFDNLLVSPSLLLRSLGALSSLVLEACWSKESLVSIKERVALLSCLTALDLVSLLVRVNLEANALGKVEESRLEKLLVFLIELDPNCGAAPVRLKRSELE